MSEAYPYGWDVRVDWQARSDWTLLDGAQRIAESLRRVHRAFPENADGVRTSASGKRPYPITDPELAKRLIPRLRRSRNPNMFSDSELFGDAGITLLPARPDGPSFHCQQVATGAGWDEGEFQVRVKQPAAHALSERPDDVTSLMADLAAVWEARNAWIDMVHVRQEWNQWKRGCPLYGWATWLHPTYATVDTSGLDIDAREVHGGVLITLRVDPEAMDNPDGDTGRAVIQELARRTVLADGRRLIDVNDRLRDALAAGT